ncbi:hypothetical protein PTNB85_07022 [Pyrenophora teres f. teres]|uniref:Uncharacterized protein n=1 Tax=Pyrenophora teres f. teres TaxID=97479 RepID=A0A6S6WJH2_9PLEO|nr:hypothetical protein HRS9139_08283 [Pyrenophora teres f. teres]KAE8832630.1 hypothetical protein PTNB85_07022 [Pyrenophora teres f. teres]KAE8856291.1 hypothetical protein PTNB29_09130 [Pyrenophora teres f. teres]CAE7213662.1 hypothetical protein PTTW11_10443 [Pyrenophora teres f. teres]
MVNHSMPTLPAFRPMEDGWRHRPAQYLRDPCTPKGWYQDGRKLHNVKTEKAFVWPKDGRNGSKWGRLKDVVQNKGPDIFVAFGAHKSDCVSNRPSRSQWAGHLHLDDRGTTLGFNPQKFAPWTRNGMLGGRDAGLSYDFRTRKHVEPNTDMWTDAIWQAEPYKNRKWNNYPEAVRMWNGRWVQDIQYLPFPFGRHNGVACG